MHPLNIISNFARLLQPGLLLIAFTIFPNHTWAISLSVDREGYVYGQFSRIQRIGVRNHAIDGEIRLGYESSIGSIHKSNMRSNISPLLWQFCFGKDDYDSMEQLIGHYVVLEYKIPKSSSLLTCSASNELTAIQLTSDTLLTDTKTLTSDTITHLGEISSGVEFGRLVNAITNKHRNRIYFLTLQIGNSGNQFRDYFTDDAELFDFAVQCLKMAAKVKLHYIEQLTHSSSRQQGTQRHILKIEIMDKEITDKIDE